jgi:hypothetical protein
MMRTLLIAAVAAAAVAPARAADHELELWLNPSVVTDVGDRTAVELETAQRFRDQPADDTYYARLWLLRELSDAVEAGVGVERRFEGSDEETRLLQQLSFGVGAIDLRTRLEQRFIESDPRTAWRLRQRVGTSIPLDDEDGGWAFDATVEGFFTLRSAEAGGQTGLTGLRTYVGVGRIVGPVEVGVGYLRQQTIRDGAPDRIGHAPMLSVAIGI